MNKNYIKGRLRRGLKVRAKINGTGIRPRIAVYRSSEHMYVQMIDDQKGVTLINLSEKNLTATKEKKTKSQKAALLGSLLAQKSKELKITSAVFDRNGYKYHGRIKALAEGAREGGLRI